MSHRFTRAPIRGTNDAVWSVGCSCGWRYSTPTKHPNMAESIHRQEVQQRNTAALMRPSDYRSGR